MGPGPQMPPCGVTAKTPRVLPAPRPLAHLGSCCRHCQHNRDLAALALLPWGTRACRPHLPEVGTEGLRGLVGLRVREHWHGERGAGGQSRTGAAPPTATRKPTQPSLMKRCRESITSCETETGVQLQGQSTQH